MLASGREPTPRQMVMLIQMRAGVEALMQWDSMQVDPDISPDDDADKHLAPTIRYLH